MPIMIKKIAMPEGNNDALKKETFFIGQEQGKPE